jgi:hypothetical protein
MVAALPVAMRLFALLLFVALLTPNAVHAEGGARVRLLEPPAPARLRAPPFGPTPLMRHGAATTILGAIQLAIGLPIMLGGLKIESFALVIPGGLFAASGAVALTAGIPMWACGEREQRRAIELSASGMRVSF